MRLKTFTQAILESKSEMRHWIVIKGKFNGRFSEKLLRSQLRAILKGIPQIISFSTLRILPELNAEIVILNEHSDNDLILQEIIDGVQGFGHKKVTAKITLHGEKGKYPLTND